jgi:ketosteroid isomerase-like protein
MTRRSTIHRSRRALVLVAVGALAGCRHGRPPAPPAPVAATGDAADAARRAVESWRQAYEIESYDALAALYAHERNLVVVRQGVATVGWDAIGPQLRVLLAAKQIRVRLRDMVITTPGTGAAVVTAGMDRDVSDGVTTISERGALTLVLRAEAESWVVVAEHYSFPPNVP